jgi:hypothetical protein
MNPIEILRQIIAKTDEGPGACIGHDGNGTAVWKGAFRTLLWEAHDEVVSAAEVSVTRAPTGSLAELA